MSSQTPQPQQTPFPIASGLATLTGTALVGVVILCAATVVLRPEIPKVWDAILVAGLLAWVTSIVGMLPVAMLGPMGVIPTVTGYFVGMGVRLTACVGVSAVILTQEWLLIRPFALSMGVLYVLLLFVEVTLVGRYLWGKDAPASTRNDCAAAGITEAAT